MNKVKKWACLMCGKGFRWVTGKGWCCDCGPLWKGGN